MAAPPPSAPPAALPPPALQFASLYVGDLHPDTTEAVLYEHFQTIGKVASCRVCRDGISRKSLGYGYVNYYNVDDAEKAMDELNYSSIKGRCCRVMWSQRDSSLRKEATGNIFVKNLSEAIDNKALHDTFSIFGHILSCKVQTDATGKSKGYGFVHYESDEAAKQAIERVNGMEVGGQQVFVGPFLKRSELESSNPDQFTNLYIKNLPEAWDDAAIADKFKEFGEVTSSVIMHNTDGKRFALVNFKEPSAAKEAIESLHRKPLSEFGGEVEDGAKDSSTAADTEAPDTEEKTAGESKQEEFPSNLLYVQRAQTKAERREQMLKERMSGKPGGKGERSGVRICVRNLNEDMTSEKLSELFEPHGQVLSSWVKADEAGKCLGFGFIHMSVMEEATKAIAELHLHVVDGKPLNVVLAERKNKKDEQAGKGVKGKGKQDKNGKGKEKGKGKGTEGKGKSFPGMLPLGPRPQMPLMPMMPPGAPLPGFPPGALPPGYPPMVGVRPNAYTLPPAMAANRPQGTAPAPMFPTAMPSSLVGMPQLMRPPMMPPAGMPAAPPPGVRPPLTREMLAQMPPQFQKQHLGERLFPLIRGLLRDRSDMAAKVTGMMLELDNLLLVDLLDNEKALQKKINEAVRVLDKQK